MSVKSFNIRAAVLGLAALLSLTGAAAAAETVRVVSSGGFAAAYKVLGPQFTRQTGIALDSAWGPSMGQTHDAVPQRLARQEPIDVLIMVGWALDDLIKQGKVVPASRADLAFSGIGIVVRAGAPKPDVSTPDALRKTLLAAKSIAYSDSASGVYIKNELFKKLGIEDQVKDKARMIPAEPVGAVVARGDAEIGFQQTSELKPITGITLAGTLPAGLNKITMFSAGIPVGAPDPDGARALIHFLTAQAAASVIQDSGMEPANTVQ